MIARLKRLAGWQGSRTPLLYLFHRGCRCLRLPVYVYAYSLMAQPVSASARLPAQRSRYYTVRFIEQGDPALGHMPLSEEVRAFRFRQGAQCLGLFRKGDLAAYLWLCPGPYDEDEVRCRFLPEPAETTTWDFDVYVMPAYRASFAFPALWNAADTFLRERGVQWSLSRISAFNVASISSHESLGAQKVGWARFFTAGAVQLGIFSQPPHLHLSFSSRSRPVIRVRAPGGTPDS